MVASNIHIKQKYQINKHNHMFKCNAENSVKVM